MSFNIRPAQKDDSAFVAEIIHLSMGRVADYLFADARQPILVVLKNLVTRNAGRFGLGLSFIAESDGCPAGALVGCEGARLNKLNLSIFPHIFPVMGTLPALKFIWRGLRLPGGREAERDEFYVSNLGVHPSAQGRGVGTRLLAYAESRAQSKGLTKCSLVVGLYNKNALRLYQQLGYRVVETVQCSNEVLAYRRMVKQLS